MDIDGELFQEIIKEVINENIYDFKLYGRTTFGDLVKYTKQIDVTKDSLIQLLNFDLDAKIDLSFLDSLESEAKEETEQTLSEKYDKIDNDVIQSILSVNSICDVNKIDVSLSNIKSIVNDEDFITKLYLEKIDTEFNIQRNLAGLGDNANAAGQKRKRLGSIDKRHPQNTEEIKSNTILEFIDSIESLEDLKAPKKNKVIQYNLDEIVDSKNIKINIITGDILYKLRDLIVKIPGGINFYKFSPDSSELYVGNSLGQIYKYNFKNQIQKESSGFQNITFKDSKAANSALCIDIKENVIAIGFQRGQVNLWRNDKMIDSIEYDPIVKNAIICVKIVKIKGKKIEYLASDLKGNLILTKRIESLFSPKVIHEKIYENLPNPIFSIDFMEYKLFVKQGDKIQETTIKLQNMFFLFGTIEDVKIAKIKPKIKDIFTYQKPLNLLDNESVPDFCFGKGCLPKLEDTFFKIISNNDPNFKVKQDTVFDLLLVTWGQEILLFCILDVNNHSTRKLSMVCRYVHNKTIFKVGFLTKSFIYIIDKDELAIKNTKLFSSNEENMVIINQNELSKITTQIIKLSKEKNASSKDLQHQLKNQNVHLIDEDFENSFSGNFFSQSANLPKKNYLGKILTINSGIVIFTKKNIKYFKLLKWKTVLENLTDDNLWEDILCLGIELIEKKNIFIIPIEIDHGGKHKQISKDLIETFQGLLFRFLNSILVGSITTDENVCIDLIIEFCIKTNLTDFLFTNIFDIILIKNMSKKFFERLEKYIFLGCFKNVQNISEKLINEIINFYISENKKIFLSKILLHFSSIALSNAQIRQCIIDNDLIDVFIYMCMNNPEQEDYFRPVEMIYTLMTQKKDNELYKKFITSHQMDLYNDEMISSRQYFGHRLLWYANFCLNGVKYPDYDPMNKKLYKDIVVKLLLFLLSKSQKLIFFDSFSFFQIMNRFFLEEELFTKICIKYQDYDYFIDTINFEFDKSINEIGPNFFIEFLIERCNEIENNFFIMKDLYDFLSNIAEKNNHKNVNLDKKILLNAIEFYMQYNNNKSETYHDPFNCHQYTFTDYSQEKELIEREIIAILNYLGDQLKKEEINNLLEKYEIGAFNNVKIVLLNKTHAYTESFEIQFKKVNKEKKDQNQINQLFEYLNNILSELKAKKDFESLQNLKNSILNRLAELSEISLDDVTNLVDNWFNDQQERVITKLSISPSLQLKYVQNYLKLHSKVQKNFSSSNKTIKNNVLTSSSNNDYNDDSSSSEISTSSNSSGKKNNNNMRVEREMSFSSQYSYGIDEDADNSSNSGSSSGSNRGDYEYKNYDDIVEMSNGDDTDEKVSSFYVLEIKLLCELKRKEDVYNIILKNINICNEEVLKILLANKVYDAAIYVYRAIGGYDDGVELTKNVIDKNYKKILRNLSNENFKEKINEMLLEKHKKYLELGISICQRVSESQEEMAESNNTIGMGYKDISTNWLILLDSLYQIKSNIQMYIKQNSNNDKTFFYNKINETISFSIELTLGKMCDYLKLPAVINIVTEEIKGVTIDFKEFKKLLLGMIFSLNQMENILKIVKSILHKNILVEHRKFKIEYNKGTLCKINKGCDLCHKNLKIDEKYVYIFKCGHCYHDTCCYKDRFDEYFCIFCKRQEIEKSVTTLAEYIQIIKENETSRNMEGEEMMGIQKHHVKKKNDEDDNFVSLHATKISSENVAKLKKMIKRTQKFVDDGEMINFL